MYKDNEKNEENVLEILSGNTNHHVLDHSSVLRQASDTSEARIKELEQCLSSRDKKDIDKSLSEEIERFRISNPNLNDETYQAVENALKRALTEIKIENKEKYNPYKNKSKGNS